MNSIKTTANKMIALTGGQAHCPAPAMTGTETAINTQDLLRHASQLHTQLAVRQMPDSGIAFPYQGLTFFFKVRGGKLAVIDELGYLVIEQDIPAFSYRHGSPDHTYGDKKNTYQNLTLEMESKMSNITQNKKFYLAPLGYFALELGYDGDLPSAIVRHPVIFWAIGNDPESPDNSSIPEAILLGGGVESGGGYLRNAPVLCPDGVVRLGGDADWMTEHDYLNDCIKDAKNERRHKAETRANVAV
jgi:hypothetical protein